MRTIFDYGPQPKSHSLHKKRSFPLRIYLVNVNISEKKLLICAHLLEKSLIENFLFCAVSFKVLVPELFYRKDCKFVYIFILDCKILKKKEKENRDKPKLMYQHQRIEFSEKLAFHTL